MSIEESSSEAKTKKVSQDYRPDPYLGMIIDNAIIERKLGQGGMGSVYQAKHRTLDKYIAIKILPPEFARDEKYIDRFLREARSAAKLEHPNIVQMYNAGEQNGIYFISMQFVLGMSLQNHINSQGRIPLEQGLWVMKGSLDGIAFAHKSGIIHRDIKPDNIMVTSTGEVKVVDFGLARSTEMGNTLSAPGQIIGTPYFMSPEQCNGERVDHRSDIYSLGITFYYMLSGIRPYEGSTVMSIIMQHMNKTPAKVLDLDKLAIPNKVSQIIRKMMEKDIHKRYQKMEEAIHDLSTQLTQLKTAPLYSVVLQSPGIATAMLPETQNIAPPPSGIPTQDIPHSSQEEQATVDIPTSEFRQKSLSQMKTNLQIPRSSVDTQNIANTQMPTMGLGSKTQSHPGESKVYQPINRALVEPPKKKSKKNVPILFVSLLLITVASLFLFLQGEEKAAYYKALSQIQTSVEQLKAGEEDYFYQRQEFYLSIVAQYPRYSQAWCEEEFRKMSQQIRQNRYVEGGVFVVKTLQTHYPSLYQKAMLDEIRQTLQKSFEDKQAKGFLTMFMVACDLQDTGIDDFLKNLWLETHQNTSFLDEAKKSFLAHSKNSLFFLECLASGYALEVPSFHEFLKTLWKDAETQVLNSFVHSQQPGKRRIFEQIEKSGFAKQFPEALKELKKGLEKS